jgi:putative hemolysin
MTRKILFTLIVLTGIVLFAACSPTQTSPTPEANLPNPASVYCEEQGNRAGIVSAPDGSQSGICVFPDGSTCDEWAYFRGECTPAEQDAPKTSEPQAAPTEPLATTSDVLIPGGWATYTSQRCEFTISHPAEMEVTNNGPHSNSISFKLSDPDQVAWNFIYVSVISPDLLVTPDEGIYNYDPAVAEILLRMQVGESKPVHTASNLAQWYTYQRQPDVPIDGNTAQTFENVQPWEFPDGTKEIRYFLPLNGCTYMIGGYVDTSGANQTGTITEELFEQIVATIQVTP